MRFDPLQFIQDEIERTFEVEPPILGAIQFAVIILTVTFLLIFLACGPVAYLGSFAS